MRKSSTGSEETRCASFSQRTRIAAFAEWFDNWADLSKVGSQGVYDSLEEYDLPLCK
jgi:hypothetical protein